MNKYFFSRCYQCILILIYCFCFVKIQNVCLLTVENLFFSLSCQILHLLYPCSISLSYLLHLMYVVFFSLSRYPIMLYVYDILYYLRKETNTHLFIHLSVRFLFLSFRLKENGSHESNSTKRFTTVTSISTNGTYCQSHATSNSWCACT